MKFRLFLLSAIVISMIFTACTETDSPQLKSTENNYPDTRLDDAIIMLTQDGRQNVKVLAKHIDRWEKIDSTEAVTVEVMFYDEKDSVSSSLRADRGTIREKSEKIALFGNVVAVNKDSTELRTQSLFWDPVTELITTEDYVEIKRADGDILKGYGLKTDRNLREIEILEDVSGKIHEILESEEEKLDK